MNPYRILAYGSSNTERFQPGMHWLDVLELGYRTAHGRAHQCLNAGLSGDTAQGLLQRFATYAAPFQSDLAIVTIGGNDSRPGSGFSATKFAQNLVELHRRFHEIGTQVVFQTYYAPDPHREGDLTRFHEFMQVVRDVAQESNARLVDHLPRWEALQRHDEATYLSLMLDGFHLNPLGNVVFGLDLSRALGFPVDLTDHFWTLHAELQRRMDQISPVQ